MTKVMVVDDDLTILTLLQTLLEFEGFQVIQVDGEGSPTEIISTLRRERPELVILDVNLKNFSGFDVLHLIHQYDELESVRILMSSGMELSSQCAQEGADGFIQKPYMPDELVKEIRNTLSA